jgi:P27 family predicted phage terminase small subunit
MGGYGISVLEYPNVYRHTNVPFWRVVAVAKSNLPNPPTSLGKAGRHYWRRVVTQYELGEADLELLTGCCHLLDRAAVARETIAQQGQTVIDRYGQVKPHPAVEQERQAWLAFVRVRRELGLDVAPADSRPPLPKGYR